MRTNEFLLMKVFRYIFVMALCCVCWSCSGEDGPEPVPPIEDVTGEVSFVVNGDNNTQGSGTSNEPTIVESGDTLSMVVSQKSSYTDPNGTVFTCEPKASIELWMTLDTIYSKDIKTLTTVNGNPKVETKQSGDNPVKNVVKQTFNIGGQEVVFDLEHEIYTYKNSKSKEIEMPYVKVNEAKFGDGQAVEGKSVISPITLRNVSLSRASIVDSSLYEVEAKFNVELESVNTEKKQSQTLEFNVNYLAVVEDVIELEGNVGYTVNGESSENVSSFTLEGGDEVDVTIEQVSSYSNNGESVYQFEPEAYISLKVDKDLVLVSSVDELKTLIDAGEPSSSVEGSEPVVHYGKKTFATKKQSFEFSTSYQVYKASSGEEMPYLKVNEPQLLSIEAVEKTSRASISDTVFYDVKATFSVELEGVNVSDAISKTLTFEVNYEGGVVSTTYLSGDIDYTINGGSNTSFSIEGGKSKDVVFKQNSSYSDGSSVVYSSVGEAKISLSVKNARVYATSLAKLKEAASAGKTESSNSGTNPKKYGYKKSLGATGQSFDFSANYEVYYASSGDEMPYLKIGEPKLLSIEAVERASRASVSDTVFYDVTAKFSVDVEGVNVDTPIQKTINFEANYIGGVVSTTDLSGDIDYTINGGNNTSFSVNAGEEAKVVLTQVSTYSDGNGVVYEFKPEAVISFKALNSSVYVESLDALKTEIESENAENSTTGTNPKKHSYLKSLATNGQLFDFSASYEVYKASSGDEMPYLKVGEPKLLSIETVERASRASVSDTVFYDVKAKFSVDVEGVNVDTPIQKTINFETTYVGGVVSKKEGPVELVSTSYRKDMIYMPPKGNLPARAACVVYRDRKYSDNSVETDSIYGGNWFMLEYTVYVDNSYFKETEGVSFGEYVVLEDNKSSVRKVSFSAEVPDLEKVKAELSGFHMNSEIPGGYSTYSSEDDNIAFESSNPVEGWYVLPVNNICFLDIFYSDNNRLFECCLNARYYDRFLYIDGRIIDFAEYRPSWDDGIFSSKNIDGGIVYTLECKGSYVGQEVHLKTEVTVTENK